MIITVKGADFSNCGIGKIAVTISDDCKEIASHYTKLNTTEGLSVLQQFMDDLGYGLENGIWNKLNNLFFPVFSSNKEEMLYDVIKKKIVSLNKDGATFEAVSPWGMKVSQSSINDYTYYLLTITFKNKERYKGCSFLVADIADASNQVSTCPPSNGSYLGLGHSNLGITISASGETKTLQTPANSFVAVDRWVDVIEEMNSLKGKFKLWYDSGEVDTGEISMPSSASELVNYSSLGIGAGYVVPTSFNSKFYVIGYSDELSESECSILRDAFVNMLKSLGLK